MRPRDGLLRHLESLPWPWPESVQVLIRDDGRAAREPKTYGGGYGLVGMRERVELLGGRFSAGRVPTGGWQVAADVPLHDPGR